jgi:hypothetical protein
MTFVLAEAVAVLQRTPRVLHRVLRLSQHLTSLWRSIRFHYGTIMEP